MRNTLAILCMLLMPAYVCCQQVISGSSLQSQRLSRTSGVHTPMVSSAATASTLSSTATATYSPPHVGSSYSYAKSGSRLSSTIYAPFTQSIGSPSTVSRRKQWGLDDPGKRDEQSPLGSDLALLLFAAVFIIRSKKTTET